MDRLLPSRYPLDPQDPLHASRKGADASDNSQQSQGTAHPTLVLLSSDLRLRCRPGELYLGASTSNGKLHLKFFWDGNVFEDDAVKEWLDEVRDAVVWYLGQD